MASDGWEKQEPGWYTHRNYGGICHERNGWYWYPFEHERIGPFTSLTVAIRCAEDPLGGYAHDD